MSSPDPTPASQVRPPPLHASGTGAVPPPKKKGGCLPIAGFGCFGLLVLALIAAVVFFYMQRQKNVKLTQQEKIVLEQKFDFLEQKDVGGVFEDAGNVLQFDVPPPGSEAKVDQESAEVENEDDFPEEIFGEDDQGRRVLSFTQREINGFLTEHPDFKDTLRMELNDDEVIVRYRATVPEGLPMAGQRVMFRGRLNLVLNDKEAHASIESLTVGGFSVPDAVIGGIKGENLFEQVFDGKSGYENFKQFVEELEISDDGIHIKLAE